MSMNEVIPGLWVGDMRSALDGDRLRENGIRSVVSAMRGRISINPTFLRYQINLDDEEDADILSHLAPAIAFIEAEVEKGRGVLIHCQAGLSRSATVACAYLMYARNMDAMSALELIRQARPNAKPNDGFLQQLEIFYQASFKVSRKDKSTRMFYLERAVNEMMNGDGDIETDMFAKYPRSPSDSVPPTPGGPHRRIRCKMCRTELARREHMMDHGQIGPSTPANAVSFSPAASRRPSMDHNPYFRRASGSTQMQPRSRLGSSSDVKPRRPSGLANEGTAAMLGRGFSDSLLMTTVENNAVFEDDSGDEDTEEAPSRVILEPMSIQARSRAGSSTFHTRRVAQLASEGASVGRGLSDTLTMEEESAAKTVTDVPSPVPGAPPTPPRSRLGSGAVKSRRSSLLGEGGVGLARGLSDPLSMTAFETLDDDEESSSDSAAPMPLSRRGSSSTSKKPTLPLIAEGKSLESESLSSTSESVSNDIIPEKSDAPISSTTETLQKKGPRPPSLTNGSFAHGSDLAAQLFANPKLAALRSPMAPMSMTPMQQTSTRPAPVVPAPILVNHKCSGYFLEPMKWMEPFLDAGQLAGKIVCPNQKCGAKLGNYDWAGVCCSCKEWVTPGFCIHRSKVDEIV